MNVLLSLLMLPLAAAEPFRKRIPVQPHERESRDYEWTLEGLCFGPCRVRTMHRFIEWMPERVITKECTRCGTETTL